jgi:uncharacterized OB-fold protein
MSGQGLGGFGQRGSVRPRAVCPKCKRSTAVTFNSRTGEAYLRPHNPPGVKGERCPKSGRVVSRGDVR